MSRRRTSPRRTARTSRTVEPAERQLRTHPVRRAFVTLGAAIVVGTLAFTLWAQIEPRTLWVEHTVLTDPDVPPAFDGARIVFASDIHPGRHLGTARTGRAVDRINSLDPDLILLGGDLVGGNVGGPPIWREQAPRLSAPLGVVAVLGNHDNWWDHKESARILDSARITLLENGNVRVVRDGESIRIAGLKDSYTADTNVRAAAKGIDAEEFAILLSHDPDPLATGLIIKRGTFDAALAGHTHGGQVTLFGRWGPIIPSIYGQRYRTGWRTEVGTPILVSNGVGCIKPWIRFWAPPQIHLIELRRGPSSVAQG